MLEQELKPTLKDLLKVDALPDNLGAIKDNIGILFDKVYFDNLQKEVSREGHKAFFNVDLLTYKDIKLFEIPGTGISIVINPADENNIINGSRFNCSLEYTLEILRVIKEFKLSNFDFSIKSFINALKNIFVFSDITLVRESINFFIDNIDTPNSSPDPVQDFVDLYNANYNPDITSYSDIEDVINQIKLNNDVLDVLGNLFFENNFNNLAGVLTRIVGHIDEKGLKSLIIPKIKASINNISLGIEIPRTILQPLYENNEKIPEPAIVIPKIGLGSLKYTTERGIFFDTDLTFDLPKCEILNTGITIQAKNVKILTEAADSSTDSGCASKIPSSDFRGVFIEDASIGLPTFWEKDDGASTAEIYAHNLLIGTGGISGIIGMRAVNPNDPDAPLLKTKFGGDNGFAIALDAFDITFRQNSIISCNITGTLTIPKFKKSEGGGNDPAEIRVTISIMNGNWKVTAEPVDEPLKIELKDVLALEIKSIFAGKQDDRYFLGITGAIDLLIDKPPITNLLPESVDIEKLIIWSDGKFEIKGGGFNLKKPLSLKFKPIELSVTALHFGSFQRYHNGEERRYMYIGFDGSLKVNPGGIEGKGSGIKVYFTVDDGPLDVFMRIQSIAIDLLISGKNPSVSISGMLGTSESGDEYIGGVSIKLKKPNLAASASMRLAPKIPAFLIDISLDLPTAIPLGATGLGIYGFRALLGQRYVATLNAVGLPEDGKWYDYYKKKLPPTNKEGITVEKFERKNGFSFGAGISLATTPDKGKVISAKLFFLLSLPEGFLLQGQAGILKGRLSLDDPQDPPFMFILAITDSSVQATFGLAYKVPEDGKVLDIKAQFDMGFFFKDKSAWYINLGTDVDPIKAEVLTLFSLYAYLMLSAKGIRTGAGFKWDFKKKYGPFSVTLKAYIDIGARIAFKPLQFGGFIAMGGEVGLKIFGFGFSISVDFGLAGEAKRPFIVTGFVKVCVRVLKKDRCVKVQLTWTKNRSPIFDPIPLLNGDSTDAKAINMLTEEPFTIKVVKGGLPASPGNLDNYVIPVDSYINIEFAKPIKHGGGVNLNRLGANIIPDTLTTELVPPQKGKSEQVYHTYSLEDIRICSWNGSSWVDYDIYQALTPWYSGAFVTTDTSTLMWGWWQLDDPTRKNKLSIMARTPVSYLRYGTPPPLENFGIHVKTFLCPAEDLQLVCANFANTSHGVKKVNKILGLQNGCKTRILNVNGEVKDIPGVYGNDDALFVYPGGQVEILLPEASNLVNLRLLSSTSNVRIYYYKKSFPTPGDPFAPFAYTLVKQEVQASSNLLKDIRYEDPINSVIRIIVEPGDASAEDDLVCGLLPVESAQLLSTLNSLAQNHILTAGDVDAGIGLEMSTTVTQYLPPPLTSTQLYLTVLRTSQNRWTFRIRKPLNPYSSRSLKIVITNDNPVLSKELVITLPPFNRHAPNIDVSQNLDLIFNFLQVNAPELILDQKNSTRFRITADSAITSIAITENHGFRGDITPDSGLDFDFNKIVSFVNIREDDEVPEQGLKYGFQITAILPGGVTAELRGSTSAMPVACCEGTTAHYLRQNCGSVGIQITQIQQQILHLTQIIAREQALCTSMSFSDCHSEGQVHCNNVVVYTQQRTDLQTQLTQLLQYQANYCTIVSGNSCSNTHPTVSVGTFVYEVCWMTERNYLVNVNKPDFSNLLNSTTAMIEGIEGAVQPIWRPDTIYAIMLTVKDEVRYQGIPRPRPVTPFTYLFQTKGPIGNFHKYRTEYTKLLPAQNAGKDKTDQFRLKDLQQYVDYTKSYPNADGKIPGAKPLYYESPKLLLFFVVDYLFTMYGPFATYNNRPALAPGQNLMDVLVRDPAKDTPVEIPNEKKKFDVNTRPIIPADIQAVINIVNASNPCINVTLSPPKGVHHETDMGTLEPLKMYTAIYRSNYQPEGATAVIVSEVLKYNFQTSQYRNFAEHINSYELRNDKGELKRLAVFDLELTTITTGDIDNLSMLVNNTMPNDHALIRNFIDPFDRLINGILKLQSLPPATSTEFNIIRDLTNGNPTSDYVLGIIVRSPEPFNDPKIPLSELINSIKILDDLGSPITAYNKIIFSKDRSSFFITKGDLQILDRQLNIRFGSLEYNKNGYVQTETVLVKLEVPSTLSNLVTEDCGSIEVELNQKLQAELVINATRYDFLIEGPNGFSTTYIRNNVDGILPLAEIAGLDYNRMYTVKAKNLAKIKALPDPRLSSYGPVCTFATRKLNFDIEVPSPGYVYVGEELLVLVKLKFVTGAVFSDFNGQVTLTTPPGVSGGGVLTFVNGVASATLQSNIPATNVLIGLQDSGNTGYGVTDTAKISFLEPATKFVLKPATSQPLPTQNLEVVVEAQGPAGLVDPGYSGSVTLAASMGSSVVGLGPLLVSNGMGELTVRDPKSEIVTFSLTDSASTGLDVSDTKIVKFINKANSYIMTIPTNSSTVDTLVTVTVKAVKTGTNSVDTNYNIGVTLVASGATTGGGLVTLTNGIGTMDVTRDTAGSIVLTLQDSEGTGLNVSSTKTINFN